VYVYSKPVTNACVTLYCSSIASALTTAGTAAAYNTHTAAVLATAADSLRALYGTDGRANAAHGSDGPVAAARECMFWFPERWSTTTAATAAGSNGATNGSTDSAQEAISTYMKDKVCATAIASVLRPSHALYV
jgi:Nucleoside diphosphate kinase